MLVANDVMTGKLPSAISGASVNALATMDASATNDSHLFATNQQSLMQMSEYLMPNAAMAFAQFAAVNGGGAGDGHSMSASSLMHPSYYSGGGGGGGASNYFNVPTASSALVDGCGSNYSQQYAAGMSGNNQNSMYNSSNQLAWQQYCYG